MELAKGVNLHFIKSNKFKTNKIKIRFSAPISSETIAGRVLSASMLETANALYPTAQMFREKLANLYGATYSTNVSRRGLVHYVDVNLSFVKDSFLSRKNVLTDEMLLFLKASFLSPLAEEQAFEKTVFEIEKKNLINDLLETEIENHFYHAHQELDQLFYQNAQMRLSRVSTVELMRQETAESSFAMFQKMLKEDKIDFFFIGDFNEIAIRESLETFGFEARELTLNLHYQQLFSSILQEGLERKDANQSILEMGYHFSAQYGDEHHLPLIVLNGLLGGFAHSKLFVNIRERESLAYTISSRFDIFSGMMRIYAGIDRPNRNKVMTLINRQVTDLKRGNFTKEDLEQTKKMLKNSILLAQDNQNTLLEKEYMKFVLGRKFMSVETWLEVLENVEKEDVVAVANQLRLQAMYFMEGK